MSTLYVVATPMGHLADISFRAIEVLKAVDVVLAEDTRHSRPLLAHYGIQKRLSALHAHNEHSQIEKIISGLGQGLSYALISDAGTPLMSDPGAPLVRAVQDAGFPVVPVPGDCAIIAALCASGLSTESFCFEGFLPTKTVALMKRLTLLAQEPRTWIFFEAPHRILETLKCLNTVLNPEREVTIAREITKKFETIRRGPIAALFDWISADPMQQKGEFVILVSGFKAEPLAALSPETQAALKILLSELSLTQAVRLATQITGLKKRTLYEWALQYSQSKVADH